MDRPSLATWIRENALTATTLDPDAPLDDLEPLRDIVGDARVVAVGEDAHHVHEFYLFRHRVLRFLAERCGFDVYAAEGPLDAAEAADRWLRGGPGDLADIAGEALTADMGRCAAMREHLLWMREHNARASRPLRFVGVMAPRQGPGLDAVRTVLGRIDPDAVPLLDAAAAVVARYHGESIFTTLHGYGELDQPARDALTAALSRLVTRMETMAAHQHAKGHGPEHDTAHEHLRGVLGLDHTLRDYTGAGIPAGTSSLDAFMAGAVLRHLDRDERTRVVLALHNCHIRRTEVVHGGAAGLFPTGFHLAAALGAGYVAIAATSDGGRTAAVVADPGRPQGFRVVAHPQGPLPAGSIESAFPGGSPLAVVDLRAARRVVGDAGDFQRMRMEDYTMELPVFDSYDAVAHVPGTHPTERAEQLPAPEHDRGAPTG